MAAAFRMASTSSEGPVEVDVVRLPEVIDAERVDAVAGDGAAPGEGRRVTVDHGDERVAIINGVAEAGPGGWLRPGGIPSRKLARCSPCLPLQHSADNPARRDRKTRPTWNASRRKLEGGRSDRMPMRGTFAGCSASAARATTTTQRARAPRKAAVLNESPHLREAKGTVELSGRAPWRS